VTASLLSFDKETHLIQPGLLAPPSVCASFAYRLEGGGLAKGFCSNLWSAGQERVQETMVWVENRLNESKWIWTGANIAYDWGCVLAVRPDLFELIWKCYEEARVFDVQIASSLHAIAQGRMRDGDLFRPDGSKIQSGRYSLDECVREWLGRVDAKSNDRFRLSYALLEHLPISQWPWDAQQYPVDDAVNTLEVAEAQLKGGKNLHDLPPQVHAAFCIHLGTIWGLRADGARVEEFKGHVQSHLVDLRAWAKEQGFMKPKTKKPGAELSKDTKVLMERVFQAYGGLPPKTDGGKTSISREALEESGDPVLEQFAELGRWEKFNTYLPTLEEAARGPLNPRSNPLLSTGRVSQEGMLLLIPRSGLKIRDGKGGWKSVVSADGRAIGVRQCFCARGPAFGCEEYIYCSCDYAAVELSTLGQVCLWSVGYSDLADAINSGKDPHCMLGANLMGITYESFLERHLKKEKMIGLIRQAAKKGNFGFPGMMGACKFVIAQRREGDLVCEWFFNDGRCGEEKIREYNNETLDGPLCKRCVAQAEVIKDGYLSQWKEIRPYWRFVMQELSANDEITQYVSNRVRGSPHGPAAANSYFQGLAADGAKRAVIGLTAEMYMRGPALEASLARKEGQVERLKALWGSNMESPLYGSRLPNFVHDETFTELLRRNLHDAAYRQAEVMVEKMREVVPDVLVKVEPAAMYFWDKSADAKFDDEKKLIPWVPKLEAA
jgi:DNA polymerase-1